MFLPEYEDSRVGDPVLLVQVRPLLDVAAPREDLALRGVHRARTATLAAHGEPAAGTPEGRAAAAAAAAAAARIPAHGPETLQADGPRAGRRAIDARLVS